MDEGLTATPGQKVDQLDSRSCKPLHSIYYNTHILLPRGRLIRSGVVADGITYGYCSKYLVRNSMRPMRLASLLLNGMVVSTPFVCRTRKTSSLDVG